MITDDHSLLPARFERCLRRLSAYWAVNKATDPRTDGLQAEVLKTLGQIEFCLARIQAIESEQGHGDFEYSTAGAIGREVEVLTEAFYYTSHRLIQLAKVKAIGLSSLPTRLGYCDVSKVRNKLIEHPNKHGGIAGHEFGWCLPNGPEIKPWASALGLRAVGCYSHAVEVADALTAVLDAQGVPDFSGPRAPGTAEVSRSDAPSRSPVVLDFEESFAEQHPPDLTSDLARASALRVSVERMIAAPIHFPAGAGAISAHAAVTFLSLLAKGYKTFRSAELLATAGWESEAATLTRTLLEAALQSRFLLAGGPEPGGVERRVDMVWAHRLHNMSGAAEKMLGAPEIRESEAGDALRALAGGLKAQRQAIASKVDVENHWSGKRDKLRGVANDLGLYHWYASAYPHLSEAAHALDVARHIEAAPDGHHLISFDPSRRSTRLTLAYACLFFADLTETTFRALGTTVTLSEFKVRIGAETSAPEPSKAPRSAES